MEIKPRHEEKQIAGEYLGVSKTTVESWIERIKEFVKDLTIELSRTCFSKSLSTKRLAQKGNKTERGKCQSTGSLMHFFVSAQGGKVGKPTVI